MPAKEIEQSLHAAQLHGGETPRAPGKPGLSFIISRAPQDLDGIDFDAGKIDRAGRGGAHALRCPAGEVRTVGRTQLGQDHHSTPVFVGRGYERALDMASARGQDFSADEAIAFAPADQPQIVRVVGVPDAEQLACSCFLRDHIDLPTLATTKHELKRIDMPLEQAAPTANCRNQSIATPR